MNRTEIWVMSFATGSVSQGLRARNTHCRRTGDSICELGRKAPRIVRVVSLLMSRCAGGPDWHKHVEEILGDKEAVWDDLWAEVKR